MRAICWLHVSDIHLRACDAWSQDVVLGAMCDRIREQRREGHVTPDFIVATGDIAFSGKSSEYALAADFFDALSAASGVFKDRIFCIPGNHDIDRERQKLCFLGARQSLQNQSKIDELLAGGEDLETLLKRQENYRNFQSTYFSGQGRISTPSGLGYVSRLTVEDVRLAIVGFDSAWLANGGLDDHGKLVVGERQVIDAINLVNDGGDPPHIVIGMAHHPFHLLQEFDRRPITRAIEENCHFFHCGHLHEPEARTTGQVGKGCLTLAAGASFETRHTANSYSVIALDLFLATRTVQTVQYNPGTATFFASSPETYSIEIESAGICSVTELAQALRDYHPTLKTLSHYLSALLLDQKAELPVPASGSHAFATFAVSQSLPASDLKQRTAAFMRFRNVLRVLYKRVSLAEILRQHGGAIAQYASILEALGNAEPDLKGRLSMNELDAKKFASVDSLPSLSHPNALLADLASTREWPLLREHARRHINSSDAATAVNAKRMLALGLAHSHEMDDKNAAVDLYRSLISVDVINITDIGNLAALLIDIGRSDEAKPILLDGIEKGPANQGYLLDIGQRIVETTGDRRFRIQLETAKEERGKRG